MPRIVLDTIGENYPQVRQIKCLKFGYLNGKESAWPADALREQHARGELLGLIDVLGTEPHQAAIIDWEHGDVQDPNRLRWWVGERNSFRGDAVVYSDKDSMPAVISALHGTNEYYQLLVANLTSDGQPPRHPTDFGLPPNVRLLGEQYAWPAKTGGPYDLSILFNDAWHAAGHAAVHLVGANATAEAADVEPGADVEPAVPTFTPSADVEPAAADPKAEIPAGPTSSVPPWEAGPFQMPGAAYSGPDPGTAFQLQGPWGATAPAAAATDDPPARDDQPFLGRPYVAGADLSGTAATTAAAAAAGINHAGLQRWISDGAMVVRDFQAAGAPAVAGVLEHALGHVLEVGKLLAAIGL